MVRVLLLGLAACSFTGKDLPSDAPVPAPDAPPVAVDAAPPMIDGAPPLTCEQKWKQGGFAMSTPTKLGGGATGRDPFVSSDETQIYWDSNGKPYQASLTGTTVGTPHQLQLYTDVDKDTQITDAVSKLSVIAGGQVMAIAVTANANLDLFLFERIAAGGFDFGRDGPIAVANTSAADYDPEITPDGTALVWAPATATGQQIHLITRVDPATQPFSNDTLIDTLDNGTSQNHADPSLSPDRTILLYTSQNAIRYAIYNPATQKYEDKGQVPNLHATTEGDAHLSSDTCRVYFGRAGTTDFDFYVSSML